MIRLESYLSVFQNLPQGVAWAEVNADLREEVSLMVCDGIQSGCESFARTAVYLRAGDGQKVGTVYTEQLDEDPAALICAAVENAKFMDAPSPQMTHQDGSVVLRTIEDEADTPQMLSFAIGLEAALKAIRPDAAVLGCSIRRTTVDRRVANSFGLDSAMEHRYYMAALQISLPRPGGGKARASVTASAPKLADIDAAALAARCVKKADAGDLGGTLEKITISSGKYDCVFSADVTCNILATAWQELVGGYMATNRSLFSPHPGNLVGSSCLNITDTPRHPQWGYHLGLDSEGTPCQRKALVRQGKLVTPLHTLESAAALNQAPTGNAGRAALLTGMVPVNLVTIPSILYIEPGTESQADLVARMGSGILLTYSLDMFHSINITSGEFSIPCGGIVYENGKPVGLIEQITMAGNLRELFASIAAVDNELTLEEFAYKNYCYGGPGMLVKGIDISSAG